MPNSLRGLNIVYPPPPRSDNPSQDLLTPPPGFPDLSAQLDLWTNLSFASDEPFVDKDRKERELNAGLESLEQKLADPDETEDNNHQEDLIINTDKPIQPGTANSASSIPPTYHEGSLGSHPPNGTQGSFDLGSFLAVFGIDPFLVPPQPLQPDHSALLRSVKSSSSSPSDISSPTVVDPDAETQPPSKRARTRKGSTASNTSVITPSALQQAGVDRTRAVSEFSEDHDPLTTPLAAAEDKRRRNTAASARFRAKKKEREQALEKRSKELETRVTELERECEGLRRENGWLKGLVVGVTGGNPSGVSPDGSGSGASESSKGKRKWDVETEGLEVR